MSDASDPSALREALAGVDREIGAVLQRAAEQAVQLGIDELVADPELPSLVGIEADVRVSYTLRYAPAR